MGLAGAKNKRKLGNDPNNTKWSRNTDTFGQKILRAQGWQPGDYLGAKDAPHAEWHTEANTTHIRVVLKDDTLGLGAKRNNGDECTGLDAFQHLLGRLNGKSDEALETERKAREDLKLNLYVERKYGTIRFVPGGWLVGDQVKEAADKEVSEGVADVSEPAASAPAKSDEEDEKARKKEKKSKKRKADSDLESDSEATKEKKDKKKSKKRRAESDEVDGKAAPAVGESLDDVDSSSEAKKSKKDRKKEKKDKKDKKEKRKKDKAGSDSGAEVGDSISKEKKRRKDGESASSAPTPAESSTSTPSGSGYSTPVSTSTRYLARSRFIAQKKMAFADSAALNQIFMIKS